MGTQRCLQHIAKMVRLLLVCLALVSTVSAQGSTTATPNTRIFGGLGNLVGGLLGGGNRPQGGHHHGGGFNQGGFGGGFNQGGFGGGFNQGGFQGGNVGGGSASCRRWCRTPQGQAYCCEGANEPISAAVTKQGQCPPV